MPILDDNGASPCAVSCLRQAMGTDVDMLGRHNICTQSNSALCGSQAF